MNWLLNLIGIMIFFINRYANRTKKTIAFSFKYWLKDNWPELATVLLLDLALMLLLFSEGTEVNFDALFSKLPFGLKVAGDLFMSFLLGLGLSSLFYNVFKKKVKDAKN
jgi:Kef-type K+ transport system membrane component KefB